MILIVDFGVDDDDLTWFDLIMFFDLACFLVRFDLMRFDLSWFDYDVGVDVDVVRFFGLRFDLFFEFDFDFMFGLCLKFGFAFVRLVFDFELVWFDLMLFVVNWFDLIWF